MSQILAYVVILILSMVAIWDVFVFFSSNKHDTVSAEIYRISYAFPPFLLWVGFILGHLFFGQSPSHEKPVPAPSALHSLISNVETKVGPQK